MLASAGETKRTSFGAYASRWTPSPPDAQRQDDGHSAGAAQRSAFCRMAAQRLRSEALPGTGGGLELIDWLEIRHDESEPVVEATRSALHYLRTLKQSIPTGPAPVVTNHDDADETEDGDALEGSQGITKRELLERQVHLPRTPRHAPPCHARPPSPMAG